jgi:hypothetical protein
VASSLSKNDFKMLELVVIGSLAHVHGPSSRFCLSADNVDIKTILGKGTELVDPEEEFEKYIGLVKTLLEFDTSTLGEEFSAA